MMTALQIPRSQNSILTSETYFGEDLTNIVVLSSHLTTKHPVRDSLSEMALRGDPHQESFMFRPTVLRLTAVSEVW